MYSPTNTDYRIIQNHNHIISIKAQVLNREFKPLLEIQGDVVSGTVSVDVDSNNRRTASLVIQPKNGSYELKEDSILWYNRFIKIQLGLTYVRDNSIHWYPMGIFCYSSASTSYDLSSNSLSLELTDLMSLLDGTKNGELTAQVTRIPATSNIRDAFIGVLEDAGITDYIIDEMGTYLGCIGSAGDISSYRQENPNWNEVPYDLEFDASNTVFDILTELKDLYSGWEMYFDEYGTFHCHMIPTLATDNPVVTYEYLDKLKTSYSMTSNMLDIRNVIHIWGKELDCDRYLTDAATYNESTSTYTGTLDLYTSYTLGERFGITVQNNNGDTSYLRINSLASYPIYKELVDEFIDADSMIAGNTYVLRYFNGAFRLLGQFQIEAMSMLFNEEPTDEEKAEIAERYNCKNIYYVVNPESPFSIEKMGELIDSKSGDDYEDITSDELAMYRSQYDLYEVTNCLDTIDISLIQIPWLINCNQKITVKMSDGRIVPYITKSASIDFSTGLMTLTAQRFYASYSSIVANVTDLVFCSYANIQKYTHELLEHYTYSDLQSKI